jgi:acetyl-CoA synthetase
MSERKRNAPPSPAPSGPSAGPRLTELTGYRDALRHFSREKLWALFDGDAGRLNIGHECLDRHPPGRTAVRVAHADGRELAWSYGELSAGSSRCAHWLEAQGVRKGDRVAIMLEPSLAFYCTLFGAMKAGAVAVPLYTLFGPEGLRLRLEDCHPALLVLGPGQRALAEAAGRVRTVVADEAYLAALQGFPARYDWATAADDLALFQYTSGTTRELPEAVRHAHRAVVTVMVAALYGTGVRPGDRFFCPASPAWGQGLWHGTVAPLALGVTIAAWAGPFDAGRMLQVLQDFGITNLAAAATHYRMMKNSGQAGRHAYRIEKMSYTGEPIDSDSLAFAQATFGATLCSMYGTTEVGVVLANYPGADDFPVKAGSLGRPVPGVEVAVLDAQGAPCPPGQVGEIMVRRRDAWFPTKDLGHLDQDGYFYHDGRADDVIISAGWTMSAVEIENVLLMHPDVQETAVIGVPDPVRGQVVRAYVVSPRPAGEAFTAELQQFVRSRLSRHEYPRQVEYTDALPKTPSGKVNRKALRAALPTAPPAG